MSLNKQRISTFLLVFHFTVYQEKDKVKFLKWSQTEQGPQVLYGRRDRWNETKRGKDPWTGMFAGTVNIGINLNSDVRNQGVGGYTLRRPREGPKRE